MVLDAGLLTEEDAETARAGEADAKASAGLNEERLGVWDDGWWTLSRRALRC
jgi:hypothetical protein